MERDIEQHLEEAREARKDFVSKQLFDAIILQIKDDLSGLKDGMKELLSFVHGPAKN